MDYLLSVLDLFPSHLAETVIVYARNGKFIPEELRVRLGQPVWLRGAGEEICCDGQIVTSDDISHVLLNATNGAFHSAFQRLQHGYLPLPGGGRLGLCGEGTVIEGQLRSIRNISSLCIRIARQIPGCGDEVFDRLVDGYFHSTLLIGPPGSGKTTLLRELIRRLSYDGAYICVADERGEISGMDRGQATFDLGPRCDVTTGIPKQTAAMMLLRTMSPDILAMDEITAAQDLPAVTEALGCGVGLLTTVHGRGKEDLRKPGLSALLNTGAFERCVLIDLERGRRIYRVEKLG